MLIDIHGVYEITLSVISFLNEIEFICLRTSIAIISTQLNFFQLLLFNTYNSIQF